MPEAIKMKVLLLYLVDGSPVVRFDHIFVLQNFDVDSEVLIANYVCNRSSIYYDIVG